MDVHPTKNGINRYWPIAICVCVFFKGVKKSKLRSAIWFRAAETWGCRDYRVFRCKKECWTVVKWCCPLRHSPKQQSWCRKMMINHWISWIQGVPHFRTNPSRRRTLTGGICWNPCMPLRAAASFHSCEGETCRHNCCGIHPKHGLSELSGPRGHNLVLQSHPHPPQSEKYSHVRPQERID